MNHTLKRITKALLFNNIEVFTKTGKWSKYEVNELEDILSVAHYTDDSEFRAELIDGIEDILDDIKSKGQDKDDKDALTAFIHLFNS